MARHRIHPDRCAPDTDDQLPLISRVGRGLQGDSYKVEIASDSNCETILEGSTFDAASKEWKSEWVSENINGGCLSYQYVLRPYTIPQTFTITFIYRRPGRKEWSWTTPAIPYIWSASDTGEPEDPDHIVGSGLATLYIKKTTETEWTEKLVYPDGTGPEDYNTPPAEEPWTVNLSFGIGGDVEVPNIDDLAKIIGITVEDIKNIIAGNSVTINGVNADNLIDYIDKQDANLSEHIHKDLGFNEPGHEDTGAFGGEDSVKAYIDKQFSDMRSYVNNVVADVLDKFYGGGEIDEEGNITWGDPGKAAVGNINLFGNEALTSYIRTRTGTGENDIRAL